MTLSSRVFSVVSLLLLAASSVSAFCGFAGFNFTSEGGGGDRHESLPQRVPRSLSLSFLSSFFFLLLLLPARSLTSIDLTTTAPPWSGTFYLRACGALNSTASSLCTQSYGPTSACYILEEAYSFAEYQPSQPLVWSLIGNTSAQGVQYTQYDPYNEGTTTVQFRCAQSTALRWQMSAWNSGTAAFIVWTPLACPQVPPLPPSSAKHTVESRISSRRKNRQGSVRQSHKRTQ